MVQPELARPYARVRLRVSYVFDLGALPYCLLLTTPLTKARSLNAYYSLLHSLRRAPSPLTTHYSTHYLLLTTYLLLLAKARSLAANIAPGGWLFVQASKG